MGKRTCKEDDCDRPHAARGWCKRHYYLWYNHGGKEQTVPQQAWGNATRTCTKCLRTLPRDDFGHRMVAGKEAWRARCRKCEAAAAREWRANNRERVNKRARDYRKNNPETIAKVQIRVSATAAGLDKDDIEAYYRSHGGLCDICQKPPTDSRLAIDHDHVTGAFRGLICRKCNSALGHFDDNPNLLRAAVRYFERDVTGLVRLRTDPVIPRPGRIPARGVYSDTPCWDCGVMIPQQSANYRRRCKACALKRREEKRRAAAGVIHLF